MTQPRFSTIATCLAAAVTAGTVAPTMSAQETSAAEPLFSQADLITPKATEAIKHGLTWLKEKQLEDGAFNTMGNGRNVAVVGLAGMAFLAAGSTPGRGEYGENINRCIDYLLDNTADSGLIAAEESAARGPMYGQGFASLFLCEVHGMADRPDLRDRLATAIDLILAAQNSEGGWRYTPEPKDADISVTVCQLMALRAARNAGIAVPRETIDRGIVFVKKCQNADGGFRYMLNEGPPDSGFARTAAGVVALYNAGVYRGPEVAAGLEFLARHPTGKDSSWTDAYFFYGQYYAAQAMWHAGRPGDSPAESGDRWRSWYPRTRDLMVELQREDGSWLDSVGPEYATAMALIVLQTPNNYLPILQR